jgi:hypothetical protein
LIEYARNACRILEKFKTTRSSGTDVPWRWFSKVDLSIGFAGRRLAALRSLVRFWIARPGAAGANNARSVDIELTKEDLADIDREFTPPTSKKSLPML